MSISYNPFDLLPPKNVIQNAIKQLKANAYELLEDIRVLRQNPLADWLVEEKQKLHQQLVDKIHRDQMYLDGAPISNNRELLLAQAKARPITDFYQGKLRKLGQKLIGKCPFHDDRDPSFVIYPNNTAHCFGCQWNGDVLDFVGKQQGLNFNEVLKFLA